MYESYASYPHRSCLLISDVPPVLARFLPGSGTFLMLVVPCRCAKGQAAPNHYAPCGQGGTAGLRCHYGTCGILCAKGQAAPNYYAPCGQGGTAGLRPHYGTCGMCPTRVLYDVRTITLRWQYDYYRTRSIIIDKIVERASYVHGHKL